MYWLKTLLWTSTIVSAKATYDTTQDQFFQQRKAALAYPHLSGAQATPKASLSDRSADRKPAYLNANSKKFVVNGKKLPDIPFDLGESYAGLLPISNKTRESRELYFWFFPSEDPKASDEITIWLNGGPGCSSLLGLFTENGPFQWQQGTFAPVKNPYSWNRLTNVVWIEQPVGTGFTQGVPSAADELELAEQFKGFWKNFVNTFALQNRKVYITGESYAGMYVPYIGNSFLKENNTEYFGLKGIAINDPLIGDRVLQQILPLSTYVDYWAPVFGLDDSTIKDIHASYDHAGFTNYTNTYFQFPPPALPWAPLPDYNGEDSAIADAIAAKNPCFNVYHIFDTCPTTFDHLGAINQGDYVPPGSEAYFNRKEVQQAINAPIGKWQQCGGNHGYVFPNGDASPGPTLDGTLANIVAQTQNVIVGSGALDFILPSNGTLFALQHTVWGGSQGFHKFPATPFFVPDHEETVTGARGGSGNLGVWAKERGLTYYDVHLAGHEVAGYALSAGYRTLQVLLGRVSDLSSKDALF